MAEAIQGVRAANDGITGITALIEAAKGLTQSARSAQRQDRDKLSTQFNTMLTQITQLAGDSSYKGKNFLKSDSLQVLFNENGGSFLTIRGFDATSAGLKLTELTVGTDDIITKGVSAGSGSQTASTSIHTAKLDSTTPAGSITLFTGWTEGAYHYNTLTLGATGSATVFKASGKSGGVAKACGMFINVAGNSFFNANGTTHSGLMASQGSGYSITAVYANGIKLVSGTHYNTVGGGSVLGSSGGVFLKITSGMAILISGVIQACGKTRADITFSFDIRVAAHASGSSSSPAANLYIYKLQTNDIGSGLSVIGMDATKLTTNNGWSGVSGNAVYVSGVLADTTKYRVSGNYLIFKSSGAPSTVSGAIQYNYNSGFSATYGQKVTYRLQFTGITLGSGQSITSVKINGITTTDFTLTGTKGNTIKFATGFKPGNGAEVTYTVTTAGATGTWASDAGINDSVEQLDAALNTLRTQTAALASNLSVVDIRQNFTSNLVNDLLKGADNLTLADTNEEGANMLMLQTRQQLGTTSLKMASDAAQSVLRLF
jgi:flagellin-like hook-associated protein FlgL